MNTNWINWVRSETCGASARQIAKKVGVSRAAVSKWLNTEPSVTAVVRIAVTYHAPLIEGLLAAGLLTDADTTGIFSLRKVPTDQLVKELRRRSCLMRKAS